MSVFLTSQGRFSPSSVLGEAQGLGEDKGNTDGDGHSLGERGDLFNMTE